MWWVSMRPVGRAGAQLNVDVDGVVGLHADDVVDR